MKESVLKSIDALKAGRMVIIVDDIADRLMGFIVQSAIFTTPQDIATLVNCTRGVICVALGEKRSSELNLPAMNKRDGRADSNQSDRFSGINFTVSVEARNGVTTGISAADRAHTIRVLATTTSPSLDLVMPGHIFPVIARKGGTLVKHSIWEAAVDLVTESELPEAAVVCHCLDNQGDLMSAEDLANLAEQHNLPTVSISDVVRHRLSLKSIVQRVTSTVVPSYEYGTFSAVVFRSDIDSAEHLALIKGNVDQNLNDGKLQAPLLVRVQAENRIGDLLGPTKLPSRQLLRRALSAIASENRGVFVYVRHPREGLLTEVVHSLSSSIDPPKASAKAVHLRSYGIGLQILRELGARRINLLSTSGLPVLGTKPFGIEVVQMIPLTAQPGE